MRPLIYFKADPEKLDKLIEMPANTKGLADVLRITKIFPKSLVNVVPLRYTSRHDKLQQIYMGMYRKL